MLSKSALAVITLYQKGIGPWLMPSCRFTPTCSQYMAEAIQRYGFWRGMWLGLRRLSRCHPWGGHGHDPVP
ncbi:MAG: membrane protein insertion efficiency factor YidD [Chitinophagales bacterium]|nr:membrane protein insertion efficiency factor YidD [Chitinophagales bacterium]